MILYTFDCTCGPGTRTEPAKDCPVHSSPLCIKQGYVTEEAYSKLESQLAASAERERVLVKELERLSVKHKESEAYYQEQLESLQDDLERCREMYKRDAV